MISRRRFLGYSAAASAVLGERLLPAAQSSAGPSRPVRLAIIGSSYHYGSELQTFADRFLVGYPLEGDWHIPKVQVVSMFAEAAPRPAAAPAEAPSPRQTPRPQGAHPAIAQSVTLPAAGASREVPAVTALKSQNPDLTVQRAAEFGFRHCRNISEALRCGGDHLAVDAVLSIVEGDYPRNAKGQALSPRYDFFQQCAQVFEEEGRGVPYFNFESLSYSFRQAQSMLATAERLKFPLLAGSPLPVTWRLPDIDIPIGAPVQEAIMVAEGGFDDLDFDALEAMQAMLERRKGGETGVKAVQLLEGDDVWAAGESGRWSKELLSSAMSRSDATLGLTVLDGRPQDLVSAGALPQLAKDPAAYCIEYNDGLKATLLMLNGADQDFTFSARVPGQGLIATQFFRSPVPNVAYSANLASKIEHLFSTGMAPSPVRRNLLTTGMLEACLTSRARLNQRIETPHLAIKYQPPADSQYART